MDEPQKGFQGSSWSLADPNGVTELSRQLSEATLPVGGAPKTAPQGGARREPLTTSRAVTSANRSQRTRLKPPSFSAFGASIWHPFRVRAIAACNRRCRSAQPQATIGIPSGIDPTLLSDALDNLISLASFA